MKTFINIFCATLLSVFMGNVTAQQLSLPIEGQQSMGGSQIERLGDIHQTADSGYIIAASTNSEQDPLVPGNHGRFDYWILKLKADGQLDWKVCLGGSTVDQAENIVQLPDESFVVCGWSLSNNGNLTVSYGGYDAWLVHLDKFGNIIWQKSVGTSRDEYARDICFAADGNLVFTGNKMVSNSNNNAWLVKISLTGNVLWEKTFGGQGQQIGYSVRLLTDGGFIIAGSTVSADSMVAGYHGTNEDDAWLIKTDSLGNIEWQQAYGGSNKDNALSVIQTSDGNYVVGGSTSSSDGDLAISLGADRGMWLFKINNSGSILWSKRYGGSGFEECHSVVETSDGELLCTGTAGAYDAIVGSIAGDITESKGGYDFWILKINASDGQLIWQKSLGGSNHDTNLIGRETSDGGYIFGGTSGSSDGNLSVNHGGPDVCIFKTEVGRICTMPPLGTIKMTGGTAKVCPGDSRTYSVPAINGVTFNWSAPAGAVITGQGSNSIQVQYTDSFTTNGNISVYTSNSCGNSIPVSLAIKRNLPPVPSNITGQDYGLCGKHNVIYSITPVAGYEYHWTMPTIGNITSGQNTNQITANFKPMNFRKTLTVSLVNACGAGPVRSKVIRAAPKEPTAITGDSSPCANQTSGYSIAAVNTATSYTWLAPSGAHITANGITSVNNILVTTSTAVSITFGPTINAGAYIKVKATNACGDGGYRALYLTACQLREGDYTPNDLSVFPNPTSGDKITLVLPFDNADELNITVYDISGKELFTSIASNTYSLDIDISKFYPGIYIIKVYDAVMTRSLRFIKE